MLIQSVLSRVRKTILTAKPSKSKLGATTLEDLCHIVGKGKVTIYELRL